MFEKKPSAYAGEIIRCTELQGRRDMLAAVPDKYRDWVEDLVRSHYGIKKCMPRRLREKFYGQKK